MGCSVSEGIEEVDLVNVDDQEVEVVNDELEVVANDNSNTMEQEKNYEMEMNEEEEVIEQYNWEGFYKMRYDELHAELVIEGDGEDYTFHAVGVRPNPVDHSSQSSYDSFGPATPTDYPNELHIQDDLVERCDGVIELVDIDTVDLFFHDETCGTAGASVFGTYVRSEVSQFPSLSVVDSHFKVRGVGLNDGIDQVLDVFGTPFREFVDEGPYEGNVSEFELGRVKFSHYNDIVYQAIFRLQKDKFEEFIEEFPGVIYEGEDGEHVYYLESTGEILILPPMEFENFVQVHFTEADGNFLYWLENGYYHQVNE